jgi:hypothetical protein
MLRKKIRSIGGRMAGAAFGEMLNAGRYQLRCPQFEADAVFRQ